MSIAPLSGRLRAYLGEHLEYLYLPGGYPGIDLLRAAAVAAVVLFHVYTLPLGWIGVDLFFVISGFLIGGAIIDSVLSGRWSFRRFYAHRALRILPTYYFFLLVYVVVKGKLLLGLDISAPTALKSIAASMFFVQTTGPYFFGWQIDPSIAVGGSWSLVIEEYFYLLCPILVVLCLAFNGRIATVFMVALAVLMGGFVARGFATAGFAPGDTNWYFASFLQFHSRFDELAAGVAAAAAVRLTVSKKPFQWLSAALGLALLGFCCIYLLAQWPLINPTLLTDETLWIPFSLGAGFALVTYAIYDIERVPGFVVVAARLSYPLYLAHIFVVDAWTMTVGPLASLFANPSIFTLVGIVSIVTLSILLSYLVSLTVEYPFIRLYRGPATKTDKATSSGSESARDHAHPGWIRPRELSRSG